MSVRILATADWQLDARGGLGPDWLDEQTSVCEQIARLAWEEDVDMVVLAGDLFEHKQPTVRELHAFQRIIAAFPPHMPILAIPGNGRHDGNYYGQEIALSLFDRLTVHREPRVLIGHDAAFCTLPWMSDSWLVAQLGDRPADLHAAMAEHLANVAEGLRERVMGPAVLVAHWKVTGASYPTGLPVDDANEPILPLDALLDQGWDAVILGDVHKPQVLSERPWVGYVGSPMPLNFGEVGCEHGVWIMDGPPFVARFVPLESREFLTFDYTPEAWQEIVDGEPIMVAHAIVKARYEATEEQARRISTEAIRQALLDAGAHRAFVQPTIVRESRARVEGMTAELTDLEAFRLWLDAEGVEERLRPVLMDAHARYVGVAT